MDEKYEEMLAKLEWKNRNEQIELKKLIEMISEKIIDLSSDNNRNIKENVDDIKRLVKNFTIIFLLTHKLAIDEFNRL